MIDLSSRRREAEWMDEPDADPVNLHKSLAFIRRINALLGYTRATLSHLREFSRRWPAGQAIDILDVATGSADIPLGMLRWADRHKLNIRVIGVDLHAHTAAEAQAATADPRLRIVRANALQLPFADRSIDYVTTHMFLHHLDDEDVVQVIREMNRIARRGIIVADLIRGRPAYRWIKLMTLLANPIVRHDAPVSVAQAFTREEVLKMGAQAGVNYARYHVHFGHRFVLAGERE